MSHHGREGEHDCEVNCRRCEVSGNRLGLAIELIRAMANGLGEDGANGDFAAKSPRQVCAEWLERNGFDGPLRIAAAKARRLRELDAEIARLQAERAKL